MKITSNSITINYLKTPYIDSNPRFSWKNESKEYGEKQEKYKIVVSNSGTIFWDTGWVYSDNSVGIEYKGIKLNPITKYDVEISVSGQIDKTVDTKQTYFKTGKLFSEWLGVWITSYYFLNYNSAVDAPILRKEFKAKDNIVSAELYICGLGYFEAMINGEKVGCDYLSIPFTRYDKHTEYRAYDVTNQIKNENAIVVLLGNGFYNCFTDDPWQTSVSEWRDVPKLNCELHIRYSDNSEDVVYTDKSWMTAHSPITFNGIRHGESYDANLEEDGVEYYGFIPRNKDNWKNARQVRAPGGKMIVSEQQPVVVKKKCNPIKKKKLANGNYLYSFKKDVAGICNINYKGKKGEKIVIKYSDILNKDGEIEEQGNSFVKNYYFQTEEYTKKSDFPELHHVRFSYFGFQAMEISGGEELDLTDIEALSLSNDIERRGQFECDDEIINDIQSMVIESTEACCVGTLAADVVREKSSWTGDTGLTTEQILINYSSEAFMNRWMMDMREAQRENGAFPCIVPSTGWGYLRLNGPDWNQPAVEVPLRLYLSTGDKKFLEENYDELTRHVNYMHESSIDNIAQFGLGDWCPPFDGPGISVNMSSYKCPVRLTDTSYYYDAVCNLALWAKILGYNDDYNKYTVLADEIKKKFIDTFYGETKVENTYCQTALGCVLYRGLYNDKDKQHYIKALEDSILSNNGKLDFGVLGMKAVSNAMGENKMVSLGLEMLRGPEYPSYGYWRAIGATTLYECWNGSGSHNHHMFSDVSEYFYKYIAGIKIDPDNPGYKTIIIEPCFDTRLKKVKCTIDTIVGMVESSFTVIGKTVKYKLVIPCSSKAKLNFDGYRIISINGKVLNNVKELESGEYDLILEKD